MAVKRKIDKIRASVVGSDDEIDDVVGTPNRL